MTAPRGTVTGVVTIAQEDRIRVVDGAGRGYLFVLGKRVWLPPRRPWALARARDRVTVTYEGEPDMGAVVTRLVVHRPPRP